MLRLAPERRHLGFLVFVFRVTHPASGASDFVIDHRDDSVIGNAALAWTIVVQHVAGPMPALLHATPLNIQRASRQPRRYYLLLRAVIDRAGGAVKLRCAGKRLGMAQGTRNISNGRATGKEPCPRVG